MKIAELSIKDIRPAESNTRVDYNGTDMAELVKSIESVGLLNPIVVRKRHPDLKDGDYEIIAGHRRFHALTKMGRATIAASIMDATDEDAEQIRLVENLHRKDLNPIEEAKAFKILVDHFHLDVAGIAQRADKSVAYVTRALALLTLKSKTQDLIAAGTLSAAHGHQIARVEGKQRDTIETFAITKLDWHKRLPTLDELKTQIEKTVERDLATAVFPKNVEKYGGTETPACVACPWNTGNQNALFDGAEKGSCTNPGCFTKRTNFAFKEMRDKVQADHPKLTFIGFSSAPGYMDVREVKGYPIIDATSKRMKDVRATPEKYGFTIRKPSRYDSKSKTSVVIVSLNRKEKPEPQQSDRDYDRERFIQERVNIALVNLASEKTPLLEKKHIIQMIETDDAKAQQTLFKKSIPELMVTLWLNWLGSWNVADKIEAIGIDTKATQKEAAKAAAKMYDEAKAAKKNDGRAG